MEHYTMKTHIMKELRKLKDYNQKYEYITATPKNKKSFMYIHVIVFCFFVFFFLEGGSILDVLEVILK